MDIALTTSAKPDEPKPDGRRERSAASRRRILAAMVDLIESGQPSPTAEAVAARAGVSLRTVFRHFEEMENLHLEIAALVFERVRHILERPFEHRSWPESLPEQVRRRAEFFEIMAPFKTAIDVYRHRSRAIAGQHRRITVMSRDLLAGFVPAELQADRERFELICLLMSLEAWQRLREQQGLTIAEATATVLQGVRAVAGLPA
jgi:AcrR family transcriptional regulator